MLFLTRVSSAPASAQPRRTSRTPSDPGSPRAAAAASPGRPSSVTPAAETAEWAVLHAWRLRGHTGTSLRWIWRASLKSPKQVKIWCCEIQTVGWWGRCISAQPLIFRLVARTIHVEEGRPTLSCRGVLGWTERLSWLQHHVPDILDFAPSLSPFMITWKLKNDFSNLFIKIDAATTKIDALFGRSKTRFFTALIHFVFRTWRRVSRRTATSSRWRCTDNGLATNR